MPTSPMYAGFCSKKQCLVKDFGVIFTVDVPNKLVTGAIQDDCNVLSSQRLLKLVMLEAWNKLAEHVNNFYAAPVLPYACPGSGCSVLMHPCSGPKCECPLGVDGVYFKFSAKKMYYSYAHTMEIGGAFGGGELNFTVTLPPE